MIPAVFLPLLAVMASSVNAGPIHALRDGAPAAPAAPGAPSPPKLPVALPAPVPRAPDMGMVPPPRRQNNTPPKAHVVVDTQPLRASVGGGDAANVYAGEKPSAEVDGPSRGYDKNREEVKASGGKENGEKTGLSVDIVRAALTGSNRRREPSDEGSAEHVGVSVGLKELISKVKDLLNTIVQVDTPGAAPVNGLPSGST